MSVNLTDLSTFQESFKPNEVSSWFSNILGRVAEPSDVYKFYKQGLYNKAITALEFYTTMPGHETCGIHLLAYSYYAIGDLNHAFPNFKKGYDQDWQLAIDIACDLG